MCVLCVVDGCCGWVGAWVRGCVGAWVRGCVGAWVRCAGARGVGRGGGDLNKLMLARGVGRNK